MGGRIGSLGLSGQFKQAIGKILESEQKPLIDLQKRKNVFTKKVSLFKKFKDHTVALRQALQSNIGVKNFRVLRAELGEGKKWAEVTLDQNRAVPGSYELEISKMAQRSGVISNGFENPNDPSLGIGYIVAYRRDGSSYELFVDESDASLNGISRLINQDPEGAARAVVVRDASDPDYPWRLILTARDEGEEKGVEFPELYFLDGVNDIWFEDDKSSQNAFLKVNGFEIEAQENDLSDFFPGVNLHLKQAKPGEKFQLMIKEDTEKMKVKVKDIIGKINKVLDFINAQNSVDEHSNTRSMFTGDVGFMNLEYRIRNLIHEGFPSGENADQKGFHLIFLNNLGIEFNRAGHLSFDEKKFKAILEKDIRGVSYGVAGQRGFLDQLKTILDGYARPYDGILSQREKIFTNQGRRLDKDIAEKQNQLEKRKDQLIKKFSKLQASLSYFQQQKQFMQSNLGGGGLLSSLTGG